MTILKAHSKRSGLPGLAEKADTDRPTVKLVRMRKPAAPRAFVTNVAEPLVGNDALMVAIAAGILPKPRKSQRAVA